MTGNFLQLEEIVTLLQTPASFPYTIAPTKRAGGGSVRLEPEDPLLASSEPRLAPLRCAVLLSGGVDSSVALSLCQVTQLPFVLSCPLQSRLATVKQSTPARSPPHACIRPPHACIPLAVQAAGHKVEAFYLQIWFQEDFRNFWCVPCLSVTHSTSVCLKLCLCASASPPCLPVLMTAVKQLGTSTDLLVVACLLSSIVAPRCRPWPPFLAAVLSI